MTCKSRFANVVFPRGGWEECWCVGGEKEREENECVGRANVVVRNVVGSVSALPPSRFRSFVRVKKPSLNRTSRFLKAARWLCCDVTMSTRRACMFPIVVWQRPPAMQVASSSFVEPCDGRDLEGDARVRDDWFTMRGEREGRDGVSGNARQGLAIGGGPLFTQPMSRVLWAVVTATGPTLGVF
jgi:hypothetical protein